MPFSNSQEHKVVNLPDAITQSAKTRPTINHMKPVTYSKNFSKQAALAAAFGLMSFQIAFAATDTWTGGASPNGNWSASANWFAGTAPSPYDLLVFTNQAGATELATNDFAAGTAFDGITFGTSVSPVTLSGNNILLSGNTNGITTGINNGTSLAETVNNNLTLDWGYHTFYSTTAGSQLNLNGNILANLGAVADFGTNNNHSVHSTSYVLDGTGLISGLGAAGLVGNGGVSGGFNWLATVSGGVVTAYTNYTGTNLLTAVTTTIGSSTPDGATNIEFTLSTAGTFTLVGGAVTYINTVLNSNPNAGLTITTNNTPGTTVLDVGTTNFGTGMYVGGFYSPNGAGQRNLTITGTNSLQLTSGPMSGNPVPGEIVFGINGNTTGNQAKVEAAIVDNGSGGKVTVVTVGTGALLMNWPAYHSGGTYIWGSRVHISILRWVRVPSMSRAAARLS